MLMRTTLLKRSALLLAVSAALAANFIPAVPGPSPVFAANVAGALADKAIVPYLNDDTFLVARLDVEKVDQDELVKLMDKAMDAMFKNIGIPPAQIAQVKAQAMQQS